MDIVNYLQPKFALMENVVDLVKFANGFLGRYALGRLVQMNYQSRLGIMAAGAYGLPQFRLRVFIWGAAPSEVYLYYLSVSHVRTHTYSSCQNIDKIVFLTFLNMVMFFDYVKLKLFIFCRCCLNFHFQLMMLY